MTQFDVQQLLTQVRSEFTSQLPESGVSESKSVAISSSDRPIGEVLQRNAVFQSMTPHLTPLADMILVIR
jgi:hypothetical protein